LQEERVHPGLEFVTRQGFGKQAMVSVIQAEQRRVIQCIVPTCPYTHQKLGHCEQRQCNALVCFAHSDHSVHSLFATAAALTAQTQFVQLGKGSLNCLLFNECNLVATDFCSRCRHAVCAFHKDHNEDHDKAAGARADSEATGQLETLREATNSTIQRKPAAAAANTTLNRRHQQLQQGAVPSISALTNKASLVAELRRLGVSEMEIGGYKTNIELKNAIIRLRAAAAATLAANAGPAAGRPGDVRAISSALAVSAEANLGEHAVLTVGDQVLARGHSSELETSSNSSEERKRKRKKKEKKKEKKEKKKEKKRKRIEIEAQKRKHSLDNHDDSEAEG
jgi:hypothetical protein